MAADDRHNMISWVTLGAQGCPRSWLSEELRAEFKAVGSLQLPERTEVSEALLEKLVNHPDTHPVFSRFVAEVLRESRLQPC